MKRERFSEIIDNRMYESRGVFNHKNDEYATNDEVFANFKDGVGISYNSTPEKYAWELLTKHLQSIKDILSDVEKGKLPSKELLDEKMNDAHNYLYLIEGMVQEKMEL